MPERLACEPVPSQERVSGNGGRTDWALLSWLGLSCVGGRRMVGICLRIFLGIFVYGMNGRVSEWLNK